MNLGPEPEPESQVSIILDLPKPSTCSTLSTFYTFRSLGNLLAARYRIEKTSIMIKFRSSRVADRDLSLLGATRGTDRASGR